MTQQVPRTRQPRGNANTMTIRVKGWAAIPVIVLLALFVTYRAVSAQSALMGQQGELLQSHLRGVYSSLALPGLRAALSEDDPEDLGRRVDEVASLDTIKFTSVGVKGTGDEVVVKVTIEVAGQPPPDGKPVRYFLLRHQNIGGWRVVREVGSFSYYLKLF